MRQLQKTVLLFAVAGSLAACVNSDVERAGVGAAAGLGTALILDTNPVVGAGVGAAAGALCDDVNLC